jgi:hypothetical protein
MMPWQDKHGSTGKEDSRVRVLKDVPGLASVWANQPDQDVTVPAGTLATVLGVNEQTRLITVEFSDVEANVFGNLSWDDVEIVSPPPIPKSLRFDDA